MAMTVVMQFRGDVICYQKNGEWWFVFPVDDKHRLWFTNYTGKKIELRDGTKFRHIDFDGHVKIDPTIDPDWHFDGILNMSSSYLHGTDAQGKSNLRQRDEVKEGDIEDRALIFFRVPGGRPLPSVMTGKDYWVSAEPDLGTERPIGRPVAAQVSLEIKLNYGVGFDLVMRDDPKDFFARIPYRSGSTETLIFDNHCEGECKLDDDFVHYSDWLEDIPNPGSRMYAGKVPRENSPFGEKIMGTVGNCDPVGSDPPPQP